MGARGDRAESEAGTSPRSKRLAFVDGLRGIAAVAVVIQHTASYFWPSFEDFSRHRFGLGAFAVALFFLCSGFVIPASLDRHDSLVQFWIGRCSRLYPLYWCSVVAALGLGLLGRFPLPQGDNLGQTVLLNLTMIQNLLGVPSLIGDYWTLCMEMVFYIAISLLFLARLHRQSEWLVGGLFLLPIVGQVIAPRLLGAPRGPDLSGVLLTLGLIFAGSAAYRWYTGAIGTATAAALAIIIPLGTLAATDPQGTIPTAALGAGNWALSYTLSHLAAYAVFALALWRRQLPATLAAIGTISYSLYLTHRLVFTAFPNAGGPLPTALLSIATTFLLSIATYRLIERPGMAIGKHLALRYRTLSAHLAARRATLPGLLRNPSRTS